VPDRATGKQPRPGWYHDPAGGGYRWWDGSAWTAHVVEATGNATASRPASRRNSAPEASTAPADTPGPVARGAAPATGEAGESRSLVAGTPARPVRTSPRTAADDRAPAAGQPAWTAAVIACLVVTGAVLLVIGSVQPWVRAAAPGVASVTRLGTDARAGWVTIAVGVFVALEAGRWLQRRRASRGGAVVALLAAVGAAGAAASGFAHLAAGVATLGGATGPVTRTAGPGLPLITAGCVAVFSGALAGALA
jgi:hypothetical protein